MRTALASRRAVLAASVTAALAARIRPTSARTSEPVFSLPIGLPGRTLGDGFFVRHGYACENTWYNPGWLHTGEDYYLPEGNTARAGVYSVADGEIVFAGSEYPGLVVIVQHADDLYSMYGHLDHALAVESGSVKRGQLLGTVLDRTDERAPSHLHFEIRTFLTTSEVNGDTPRYSYGCGFNCAPGPGYWPIDAPEHPSDMGWRNPTHVLGRRAFHGAPPGDAEAVVSSAAGASTPMWSEPSDHKAARRLGDLALTPGERYRLYSIATGPVASRETSAEGYRLWYRVVLPDGDRVWVRAVVPSSDDSGSDGRPSSLRFDLIPAVMAR
ncbi:MAG: hypothetical protein QOF73_2411 [Thermomicrobiales bacterium]|nr:hypothetical protein [Thermomicrobiales bacterium]